MDSKKAKTLLDYVKADTPKYGVSSSEPAGSGPGGAAATNKRVSRINGSTPSVPSDIHNGLRDAAVDVKMTRAIDQMKQVRNIYNSAADTLKKKLQINPIRSGTDI